MTKHDPPFPEPGREPAESYQRAFEVFVEAAGLAGAARARLLDERCAGDPDLRLEVESLLHHDAELSSHGEGLGVEARRLALEAVAGAATSPTPDGPASIDRECRAGERLGPYRLLQLVGEGGFGSVFAAEHPGPPKRRVAIKVLKAGMASREVLARFDAERNALEVLNHPAIARVSGAGTTPSGRPYFVLEYVEGQSITEFCDEEELGIEARLRLFIKVCEGIQYAHQSGIIHRDLKPSNILVTLEGGEPQPKIIDFGIAKATGQALTDQSVFTLQGQLLGTLEYMSPEQAEMSPVGVDSTSDIYSLGVILYELMTGLLPFDAETLRQHGVGEVYRVLREVEPVKPSTRVSTVDESVTGIGRHRRSDPRSLRNELKGDLDWIVMRAIDKLRTRRYASASEFAADVQRHLDHEPVLAGPPSAGYRIRKFARRHRVAVSFVATVTLLLIGGIVATSRGMVLAARERDAAEAARKEAEEARDSAEAAGRLADERRLEAEESRELAEAANRVSEERRLEAEAERERAEEALAFATHERDKATAIEEFLVETLGLANPEVNLRPDMRMADALDLVGDQVEERFAEFPDSEFEVRFVLGRALDALGRPDLSLKHLQRAREIQRRHGFGSPQQRLEVIGALFSIGERTKHPNWVSWGHESYLKTLEELHQRAPDLVLKLGRLVTDANVASISAQSIRSRWEDVASELEERLSDDPFDQGLRFVSLYGVAEQLGWNKFSTHAPEMIEGLLADSSMRPNDRRFRYIAERAILFRIFAGDYEGAEARARARISELAEILGPDHIYLVDYRSALAECLTARGEFDEALRILEDAIETLQVAPYPAASALDSARMRLAHLHEANGRSDLAGPHWDSSVDSMLSYDGPVQWLFVKRLLRPRYKPLVGAMDDLLATLAACTADGVAPADRADEVSERVEALLAARRAVCPDDDRAAALIATHLIENAQASFDVPELHEVAEACLRDGLDVLREHPDQVPLSRLIGHATLASILEDTGRLEEAQALWTEVDADVARNFTGPGDYRDDAFGAVFAIWQSVRRPGASPATYDALADWGEACLVWTPMRVQNLTTCGAAQLRAGRYEAAVETLQRADEVFLSISGLPPAFGNPQDMALLAMAHHHLGEDEAASAAKGRMKLTLAKSGGASDRDTERIVAEVEALLEKDD